MGRQAESEEHPEVLLDADGRLTVTLRCIVCSYNLRGLALDGMCPECAAPARKSLLHNDLRLADPAWLRKIHLGLFALMLAVGLVVATVLAFLLVGNLLVAVGGGNDVIGNVLVFLMMLVIYLAAPLVGTWGLILCTTVEPLGGPRGAGPRSRKFTRWATLAVLGVAGLAFTVRMAELGPPPVLKYSTLVAMFLPLVPLAGLLRLGVSLLERTKESKLARQAKQSSSGILGFVVLLVAASVACVAVPQFGEATGTLVSGFGVLIGLICLANVFTLLRRVRRVLTPILEDAEDNRRS